MKAVMTKPVREDVMMKMVNKIFMEELSLTQELGKMEQRGIEIHKRLDEILLERQLLDTLDNSNNHIVAREITSEKTTLETAEYRSIHEKTVTVEEMVDEFYDGIESSSIKQFGNVRMNKSMIQGCEDAVRSICMQYGRPIKVSVLIEELSEVGYVWNRYVSAHAFVTKKLDILESPSRGYYQLRR